MPLLRRTHDYHRDLRARLRAQAPSHTRAATDQDRYLMTPSHPINDRSGRLQSRWFASSNPAARDVALDSKPRAAPIWSPTVQPAAVPPSLAVYSSTNQLLRPHRATILRSRAAAKSP